MSIRIARIDPVSDERWDAFVDKHPNGLVCHLSGWQRALESAFAHIKNYCLVLLDDGDGQILAGLPIYLVRSRFLGNRLVSVPFATLSHPLTNSADQTAVFLPEIARIASRLRVSTVDIRVNLNGGEFPSHPDYTVVRHFKHHFLVLSEPLDEIQKRLHKTCVRRVLNRCRRTGLKLRVAEDANGVLLFYQFYLLTRKRLGLPPQPLQFFQELWDQFAPAQKIRILHALWEGKPIASILLFCFRKRMSWEAVGVAPSYSHLHPNHFLLWEAIQMAHREGFEIFDLGRTSSQNLGLMQFKDRWGTVVADLAQAVSPSYESRALICRDNTLAYRTLRNLIPLLPLRLVRQLGDLCYKHLG